MLEKQLTGVSAWMAIFHSHLSTPLSNTTLSKIKLSPLPKPVPNLFLLCGDKMWPPKPRQWAILILLLPYCFANDHCFYWIPCDRFERVPFEQRPLSLFNPIFKVCLVSRAGVLNLLHLRTPCIPLEHFAYPQAIIFQFRVPPIS